MQHNSVRLPKRIRGQGMTEYIIIVALIAIAAIAVTSLFGGTIRNQMAGMASEMSGQTAEDEIGQAKSAADKATTIGQDTGKKTTLGTYDKAATSQLKGN